MDGLTSKIHHWLCAQVFIPTEGELQQTFRQGLRRYPVSLRYRDNMALLTIQGELPRAEAQSELRLVLTGDHDTSVINTGQRPDREGNRTVLAINLLGWRQSFRLRLADLPPDEALICDINRWLRQPEIWSWARRGTAMGSCMVGGQRYITYLTAGPQTASLSVTTASAMPAAVTAALGNSALASVQNPQMRARASWQTETKEVYFRLVADQANWPAILM